MFGLLFQSMRAAAAQVVQPRPLLFRTNRNALRHDARIVFDYSPGGVVLAVYRQLNLVSSGLQWRAEIEAAAEAAATAATAAAAATATATGATAATTAAAEAAKSLGRANRFAAEVPLNPINTDVFCAGERTHDFAGVIADRDLHVTLWRRLQVVTDRRARDRIRRAEPFRATGVAAQAHVVIPEHARTNIEQRDIALHLAELLQGADVIEDVNPAAMRADDQIVITWMDENVVDPNARHARHEFLVGLAAVERCVKSELSAYIQQVFVLRIFAHHVDVAPGRQVVGDIGKGRAVIAGHVQIRLQIIEPMAIDRYIASACVKVRRLDAGDVVKLAGLVSQDRNIFGHVGPVHTAVATNLDVAVVGAGPN